MSTNKGAAKGRSTARAAAWDDPENEAQNNFVGFNEIGDFILGALLSAKQVPSTLPDRQGEMQWVYEFKVREALYHLLDDRKNVIDEAVEPAEGDIVSVGGRKVIDSRMARVKVGQVVGLKFVEELPAKTKGYNPTKLIKVFTPKLPNGDFEFDEEVLAAHGQEELAGEFDK